ncbi:Zn(II)2Cys6 transcription factor domain-containing protein [Aspergillus lucknowensis]|uniref:Zn(2)-C6 fungal-type domain-containing protein n=1 Tax=Aspergillus lucknowensis TaxID=176173 RepID=A0ABR4LD25_9EURO
MPPNPITLRRSCEACAKGKRHCDRSLPRCSRCSAKRIACEYINVPLAVRAKAQALSETNQCRGQVMKCNGTTHIRPSLRVEILKTHDRAIIQFLIDGMRQFPITFAEGMKTLFIHPHLYDSSLPQPIRDIHTICRLLRGSEQTSLPFEIIACVVRQKSAKIRQQAERVTTFEELLACIQALILAQCILIFHGDEDDEYAEYTNSMLASLARRLWEQAPIQLPGDLSLRRAWLFAESVRRTIIVSYILCGAYSLGKRNYSMRTPFVDALPFDVRTSLWDAPSEDSWEKATSSRPVSMVSLREYSDMLAAGRVHQVTTFGSLILAACKGLPISSIPFPPINAYEGS